MNIRYPLYEGVYRILTIHGLPGGILFGREPAYPARVAATQHAVVRYPQGA